MEVQEKQGDTPREPNANQKQKKLLADFWMYFGGQKNNGRNAQMYAKLKVLKQYAEIVVPYKTLLPLPERRKTFNRHKFHLHNIDLYDKCFLCVHRWAKVRHHIIQLQNGGMNSRRNLVSLCEACHAEIHPHLKTASTPPMILPPEKMPGYC